MAKYRVLICSYCQDPIAPDDKYEYCPLCDDPEPRHADYCAKQHRRNHGFNHPVFIGV